MRLGVSTLLFSSHHIVDAVREIACLGHDRIELFCELAGLDVDTVEDATTRRLAELADEHNLEYSIHPPLVNTAAFDEGERAVAIHKYRATLALAGRLGIRDMVIHSGHRPCMQVSAERSRELARRTLRAVGETAGNVGVRLLLENTGWHEHAVLDTPGDLLELAESACPPDTGILLDTGHAVLQSFGVVDCARTWLPRLAQVHAHDNSGEFDEHLPLGEGVIDWNSLIGLLVEAGWDGVFMLELGACDDAPRRLADSLDLVARCADTGRKIASREMPTTRGGQ
jgi:sugar phosphate isomerase/epimerase